MCEMSEAKEKPVASWADISKRAYGKSHAKPCKDPDVISCRRFICQKAGRCQMKPAKAKEDAK